MIARAKVSRLTSVPVLAVLALAGCLSSSERDRMNDWLLCDDCTLATRDSVARLGFQAVPRLGGALYGPPPHRDSIMRFKLRQMYALVPAPRVTEREFVDFHAANYRAQYQEHAALALGEIGRGQDFLCRIWGCAKDELQRAFRRDSALRVQGGAFYTTDVLYVIRSEIESLGDPAGLPIDDLVLGFAGDTLNAGVVRPLAATVLDIGGREIPGATYAWTTTASPAIATISPTGVITAIGPGIATIHVEAAVGPLTLADSAAVIVQ